MPPVFVKPSMIYVKCSESWRRYRTTASSKNYWDFGKFKARIQFYEPVAFWKAPV
jgi:hypothetical protein